MADNYDFDKLFQVLDQMEACVDRVRKLNKQLDENSATIPQAA